jgi:phage terminase large subunit-like protein
MLEGRKNQQSPDGEWLTWLILSGRGWGKSRTGAEWLAWNAVRNNGTRWAVVAPTFSDARDTCVEGESGIKAVLDRYKYTAKWNRSLGEMELFNGSRIKLFSADEPERLRGPQHHGAWCDELASWRYDDAWDQLQFGLRLGAHPQTVVTTTPKPRPLIRKLIAREGVHVTRGSTFENAANLSASALAEFRERYEGTRLGRQELYGEVLDDVEGALWTWGVIEANRVTALPDPDTIARTVVAIDPSTTADGDETGIVTAQLAKDGHLYVTTDASMHGSPDAWARTAVMEYERSGADCIVVEGNQGGDSWKTIIHTIAPNLPVKKVTATRGKQLRAEPVAALYEQGKVHHVGVLPTLEDQMTSWTPFDKSSPDRLDALVWACTELAFKHTAAPVRSFRT